MIAIILISAIVMPPFIWALGYMYVGDQPDGTPEREASKRYLHNMVRHPAFIIWCMYVIVCFLIFSGVGSAIMQGITNR